MHTYTVMGNPCDSVVAGWIAAFESQIQRDRAHPANEWATRPDGLERWQRDFPIGANRLTYSCAAAPSAALQQP
ncbi:MAG: hypothetical protein AB7Q17_06950 [Phycisphaerae bacterium]